MTNPARRSTRRAALWCAALLTPGIVFAVPALAAQPSKKTVVVSSTGSQVITWTGTVLPGATGNKGLAADPCANRDEVEDVFTLTVQMANARVYKEATVTFTISYAWEANTGEESASDIEMEVFGPSGAEIGESTGSSTSERFTSTNFDEGDYRIVACPASVAVPQDYNGKIEIFASPKKKAPATTTTQLAAGSGSQSGGSVKPPPSSGPTSIPTKRAPTSGVGRTADLVGSQTVVTSQPHETPAAPSAFLGGPNSPLEAAAGPAPLNKKATDTKSVPLAVVILITLFGVVGGIFALIRRRREGLDLAPGTAVVPVS